MERKQAPEVRNVTNNKLPSHRSFPIVRDAAKLQVFDLNFLTSSESVNVYAYNPRFRRYGTVGCIVIFFGKLARSAFSWRPFLVRRIPQGSVLAAVENKNEYDALAPVVERLEEARFMNLDRQPGTPFPVFLAFVYALPFWPLLIAHYRSGTPFARRTFRYVLHHYWLTYGWYIAARILLRRCRPKLVFVSNDHNMKTRTLLQAARDEGIRTAYIQHASVTDRFPPLSVDFAFLDGRDAMEKYASVGTGTSRVFLAGSPKFDAYYGKQNVHESVSVVAVCANFLDREEDVLALCKSIRARFPALQLVLRPHPADERPWGRLAADTGVSLSDSRAEISYAFLERVDAIITGESNIALEALLMNVVALHMDLSKHLHDSYGFVQRGSVPHICDEAQLMEQLAQLQITKPTVRPAAKPYCETVGTQYDGQSSTLVARTLDLLLRPSATKIGGDSAFSLPWRRVPEVTEFEAYVLAEA